MKYSLFLFAVLIAGMLMLGAVYAGEGSSNAGSDGDEEDTSTSDIFESVPDIEDDDLLEQEVEIEDDISGKRVRAALGFYGQGYAVGESAGHFVRITGIHKTTVSPENERLIKSVTVARLGIDRNVYKLERTALVLEEELPGTMTFTAVKDGDKVGELKLSVVKRYDNGFVVRTGTLTMADGKIWDLALSTRSTPIKGTLRALPTKGIPVVAAEAAESDRVSTSAEEKVAEPRNIRQVPGENSGRKRGFFARLFKWEEERSKSGSEDR